MTPNSMKQDSMKQDSMSQHSASLQLSDITLTYPDGDARLTALDAVTLTAKSGELTAVVGPSGSGKSSLLAVAATLITPDSGEVTLGSQRLTGLSRAQAARIRREQIGIVFQQSNLVASLTAVEQLTVMAHLTGGRPAEARDRAVALLDAVGLSGSTLDRRPHQLSGGQRQRVNIARALMNDPGVLLVDEPTSSLDSERGAAILDLLVRLTRERSVATVMVTHDHSHLAGADQVIEMVDGRAAVLTA